MLVNKSLTSGFDYVIILFSIFLIFQRELMSFGLLFTLDPISIFSGLYLNDLGLFLPLWFIFKHKNFLKSRVIFFFVLTFTFGFIIYLFKIESSSNIGPEFRLFISFFSGISIILSNSFDLKKVIRVFSFVFLFFNIIIFIQLIFLPDFDSFLNSRIGSESIYNLLGPQLILLPTLTSISLFLNNNNSIKIMIFNFFLAILFSIIFLKARSLTLLFFAGLILSLIVGNKINKYALFRTNKNIYLFLFGMFFSLIFLLNFNSGATDLFIERIDSAMDNTNDSNIQSRLLEPIIAFSDFSSWDWFLGAGMAPPSILVSENGQTYNSMHIGVLNILWRFGLIIFVFWFILFIKFIYISFYYSKNKKLYIFIISPSIIIWFIVSLFSGGWGLIPIFCLGVLLGISFIVRKKYINSYYLCDKI